MQFQNEIIKDLYFTVCLTYSVRKKNETNLNTYAF